MSFLRLRARIRSLLATGSDEVVKLAATCETVPREAVERLEAKQDLARLYLEDHPDEFLKPRHVDEMPIG